VGNSLTSPVDAARFEIPPVPVMRLSVGEYHEMIQAGILVDGEPIELLEGWLVRKMTKNPPHEAVTRRARVCLENLVGDGWSVDTQAAITTLDSEPEPDVRVVRGDTAQFLDRHPQPEEIALVIEVADSSLQRDRTLKQRIYARAGIPEYWIVNLIDNQIERLTSPDDSGEHAEYQTLEVFQGGDTVPLVLDGEQVGEIKVAEILP